VDRADPRSAAELRADYAVEKELADRLRRAPADDRARLYPILYDEMFRRTPRHPQLRQKASPAAGARLLRRQLTLLRPFLRPETSFLEVGAGDCALSFAVAGAVRRVYGADVSAVIAEATRTPANFELLLTDGVSIPLPAESVDLAYSYQLMEHLHADDAVILTREIARVLKPGGAYLCVTPSRVSGPHDISKYFTDEAAGFHLREYAYGELHAVLRAAGFATVTPYLAAGGVHFRYPAAVVRAAEALLGRLPRPARRRVASSLPARLVLGLRVVAHKPRNKPRAG
jgi:SAM-dependent methyltransferase